MDVALTRQLFEVDINYDASILRIAPLATQVHVRSLETQMSRKIIVLSNGAANDHIDRKACFG
jgi:hypothetical protein